MELGGKNSAIVCEDANMETDALAVAMGAFLVNVGRISREEGLGLTFHSQDRLAWRLMALSCTQPLRVSLRAL